MNHKRYCTDKYEQNPIGRSKNPPKKKKDLGKINNQCIKYKALKGRVQTY